MNSQRHRIVSLGGGLDSWAMLLDAKERGELPDVVAFVDVGDADDPVAHPGEWDGTYRHITEVVRPWCAARGIEFVEISARTSYLIRPENQASRSLFQWMWDMDQIPVAGPNRLCTRIAKVERFERWLDDHYAGQEVEVWIGFDASETSRVENDPNAGKGRGPSYGRAPAQSSPLREVRLAWRWTRALAWAMSHAGRVNRFPLVERGMCRCRCEALARASGYPVPRKSACVGCCYNTKGDWQRLAAERPLVFNKFVQLEAKKPLTKKGHKLTISAYDSRTQTGIPLSVLVQRPYTPQVKPCLVCGAPARATKAVGCGYLEKYEYRTCRHWDSAARLPQRPKRKRVGLALRQGLRRCLYSQVPQEPCRFHVEAGQVTSSSCVQSVAPRPVAPP